MFRGCGRVGVTRVHAFSLIELMVVVSIVAILSAVAVPSYKNEVLNSQVASLIPILDSVKLDVMEQHNFGTVFGATQEVQIASDATTKPKFLGQLIRDSYGCVTVEYDLNQLGLDSSSGQKLSLVVCPLKDSSNTVVTWNCGYSSDTTTAYQNYVPSSCRQVVTYDSTF